MPIGRGAENRKKRITGRNTNYRIKAVTWPYARIHNLQVVRRTYDTHKEFCVVMAVDVQQYPDSMNLYDSGCLALKVFDEKRYKFWQYKGARQNSSERQYAS